MRMGKKLALKFYFILIILCFIIIGFKNVVKAEIGDSGVIKVRGEETVSNLLAGAKLHKQDIEALLDCTGDYYYPFGSQYLESLPNHEGIKMVSWSYRNEDEYQMKGVTEIAENFEKLNPGWKVIGGTNADFFDIGKNLSSGCMDSNAYEMGEMIHARNITTNETWRGIFGFTEDSEMIIGIPEITNHYNLHIYTSNDMKDEKDVLAISGVNPSVISDTGITLITKDASQLYDLREYNVILGKYDLCRQTKYDGWYYYLKGTILEKRAGVEFDKPKDILEADGKSYNANEFYLVSKDDSVNKLDMNSYVKIQKDYLGKYKEVENAVSYYWKILDEGHVMFEGHTNPDVLADIKATYPGCNIDYITCRKSRCLFGVKEDGSYVMAVIDGTTQTGLSLSEAAYYMKEIGCINAWDFDGGGSATLIARDENGFLQTINSPSDTKGESERNVGNALLMVTRDSGFVSDMTKSTSTSVTLDRTTLSTGLKIEDVSITINGITKNIENDETSVTFDNLAPGSKHLAKINFTTDGQKYSTIVETETLTYNPDYKITSNTYGFTITRDKEFSGIKVISATVYVDDKPYNMQDKAKFTINDLMIDYRYELYYSVTAQIIETGQTITYISEKTNYDTLPYVIPYIEKLEENRKTEDSLRIKYSYEDPDNFVIKAYLTINGIIHELNSDSGSYTFEELDFNLHNYYISLVLEYEIDDSKYEVISEPLVYNKPECNHEYDNDCDKDCNLCGATRTIQHIVVKDEKVNATCDKRGLTEGSHCSVCNEIIKPQEEIKPLGHSWKEATKQEPKTCTICGKTEGTKLKGCKKASITNIISSIGILAGLILIIKKKK